MKFGQYFKLQNVFLQEERELHLYHVQVLLEKTQAEVRRVTEERDNAVALLHKYEEDAIKLRSDLVREGVKHSFQP